MQNSDVDTSLKSLRLDGGIAQFGDGGRIASIFAPKRVELDMGLLDHFDTWEYVGPDLEVKARLAALLGESSTWGHQHINRVFLTKPEVPGSAILLEIPDLVVLRSLSADSFDLLEMSRGRFEMQFNNERQRQSVDTFHTAPFPEPNKTNNVVRISPQMNYHLYRGFIVFTRLPSTGSLAVRCFYPKLGVIEDAATASGQALLAGVMHRHYRCSGTGERNAHARKSNKLDKVGTNLLNVKRTKSAKRTKSHLYIKNCDTGPSWSSTQFFQGQPQASFQLRVSDGRVSIIGVTSLLDARDGADD